jgi:hypothetical protein
VKKYVRVYVEGGAEGKTADNDFRRGWRKFLHKLHELARQSGYQSLDVVRGKGRSDTFRRFRKHQRQYSNDLCVLLVDAETVVPTDAKVWDIVAQREGDKRQRPDWAKEEHLYLMVAFVETWLHTDQEALATFFKRGFNHRPLPTTDLENRSKDDVESALKRATKDCRNGPYRHGQAHEVIEFVCPEKVQSLSHGKRLFESLSNLINNQSVI